jgi:hypothetical protein
MPSLAHAGKLLLQHHAWIVKQTAFTSSTGETGPPEPFLHRICFEFPLLQKLRKSFQDFPCHSESRSNPVVRKIILRSLEVEATSCCVRPVNAVAFPYLEDMLSFGLREKKRSERDRTSTFDDVSVNGCIEIQIRANKQFRAFHLA